MKKPTKTIKKEEKAETARLLHRGVLLPVLVGPWQSYNRGAPLEKHLPALIKHLADQAAMMVILMWRRGKKLPQEVGDTLWAILPSLDDHQHYVYALARGILALDKEPDVTNIYLAEAMAIIMADPHCHVKGKLKNPLLPEWIERTQQIQRLLTR